MMKTRAVHLSWLRVTASRIGLYAIIAAGLTVILSIRISSFDLPTNVLHHSTYSVQLTRNGGNYCTRTATVTQIAATAVMLISTCSFKRAEAISVERQDSMNIGEKYSKVLEREMRSDHPDAPSQDSIWQVTLSEARFVGLDDDVQIPRDVSTPTSRAF